MKIIISLMIVLSTPFVASASYRSITPHAVCKDGTYSYSIARQGTCSGHKGVRYWLR